MQLVANNLFDDVCDYVRQRGCIRNGDPDALIQLLRLLCQRRIIPDEPATEVIPAERVIAEFSRHLQEERALAPSAVPNYVDYAKRFLIWRFGSRRIDLSSLRAGDLVKFVQHQAAAVRSEAIKNVTTALRSFLASLRYRGDTSVNLAVAVPRVANWSPSPIPKGLPVEDVRRVLENAGHLPRAG